MEQETCPCFKMKKQMDQRLNIPILREIRAKRDMRMFQIGMLRQGEKSLEKTTFQCTIKVAAILVAGGCEAGASQQYVIGQEHGDKKREIQIDVMHEDSRPMLRQLKKFSYPSYGPGRTVSYVSITWCAGPLGWCLRVSCCSLSFQAPWKYAVFQPLQGESGYLHQHRPMRGF